MAQFNLRLPSDFTGALNKLGNIDEIAPIMLKEAAPIMVGALQKEAAKHQSTGDLVRSIKAGQPKSTKTKAWMVSIFPTGSDRKGVRNAEKMVYLEHGTSKMSPCPMIASAAASCQEEVSQKLQEVFNREIST